MASANIPDRILAEIGDSSEDSSNCKGLIDIRDDAKHPIGIRDDAKRPIGIRDDAKRPIGIRDDAKRPEDYFPPDLLIKWRSRFAKHPEANILQSPEWATVNLIKGDGAMFCPLGQDGFVMAIIRNAKRGRYLEIPAGPIIDWDDVDEVEDAIEKIRDIAEKNNCAFIRIRPQILDTPAKRARLKGCGFSPAPMHLGAQNTVMVDLTKTEEDLLASFRRQTRYEIRQAEKRGIIVEKHTNLATFRDFHEKQLETARRQHFVPPDFTELKAEHDAFGKNAVIYSAKTKDGDLICYGLILKAGLEGDYFEAASTELGRQHPGAYAIQWQVIKDLKAEGFKRYNLFGIAPPNQPNHRYAKVTTFKTGFGEVQNFVPAHDLALSSLKYGLDYLFETARRKRRHL